MASIDKSDDEQQDTLDHADRSPALLASFDPVLLRQRQIVVENESGKLEADAMLAYVALGLR